MLSRTVVDSPIGPLLITANDSAITGLIMVGEYGHDVRRAGSKSYGNSESLDACRLQLDQYFAGRRREFDVPLEPSGTEFQRRVWIELTRIPYGVTISYGELARRIGNPNGSRAVGLANGQNPISILIPCHRVIGANGKLVGYGGGLHRKEWLLNLETTNLW